MHGVGLCWWSYLVIWHKHEFVIEIIFVPVPPLIYTLYPSLDIYHNLPKLQNFIAAKFSAVALCVVGSCIYFVALYMSNFYL